MRNILTIWNTQRRVADVFVAREMIINRIGWVKEWERLNMSLTFWNVVGGRMVRVRKYGES